MISRRDAILASFGLLASSQIPSAEDEDNPIQLVEHEANQILYVLRHPNGTVFLDENHGDAIPASEIARTLVENMRPGSRVCLPGDLDYEGNYAWDLKIFDLRRGKTEEIEEVSDSLKSMPCKRTNE